MSTYNYDTLLDSGALITSLTTSEATLVTVPASAKYFVQEIFLHYTGTEESVVTLYLVQNSGGSVGTSGSGNQFMGMKLYPDDKNHISVPLPTAGLPMTAQNDTIKGKCSAGTVNIIVSGTKETTT